MDKGAMKTPVTSTPAWDELEEWTRGRIQEWMQQMLVDEVTDFLGRAKHQRRGVDMQGYRNGYGKPRRLTMRSGTITVRRPRVRDLDERFESRLLPLFTPRTNEVRDLLPDLYLHGLASGDFELALSGLLGDQAALSASTVARVKERWQAEYSEWQQRRIEDEIVYLWLDGVYLKAGLEKEKAALLVAIGVKTDGRKVVLAVSSGYRESTASWSGLLRELRARGMNEPRLVVGDGNLGLWSALRNVFPGAEEQRCWNHRLVNLLTQVPKQRHGEARELLTKIPYQASERQAQRMKRVFQNWCVGHGYERAAELIDENWEQMVTFYRFRAATGGTCEQPMWWSRRSRRCGCAPTPRSGSRRSPTRPPWYGKCCWSPNASSGVSTRLSYCRPWPPDSSITTAYRSEEANTKRPPPDLFTHLLTEPPCDCGPANWCEMPKPGVYRS